MRQDFEFIAQKIEDVHPIGATGLTSGLHQAIYDGRTRLAIEQPTFADYFWAVSNLLSALDDRQSHLIWPIADKALDLPLYWCADGLYVISAADKLEPGDRVLSMGGQSTANYEPLSMVAPYLSAADGHEIGRVLTSQHVLQGLSLVGVDGLVNVEIQRGDQKQSLRLTFAKEYQPPQADLTQEDSSWSLEPENSLGIFCLNELGAGASLQQQLREFFAAVQVQNLQSVVLDLRHTRGSDWQTAQELLRYLDVESYEDYGESVRSPGQTEMQTRQPQRISNDAYRDIAFHGQTYVLVAGSTSESACRLAALLCQNRLAQLVGQSVGRAAVRYGKAEQFTLPASKLRFTISSTEFLPPGGGSAGTVFSSGGPAFVSLANILAGADVELRMARVMAEWGERLYQAPEATPLVSLEGKTLEQAAREWLEACFLPLKSETVSPRLRLADFSIQWAKQEDPMHGHDNVVWVQYSLKPAYPEFYLAAGNGIWDGAWLKNEERFLVFKSDGELYRVDAVTGL